MERAQGRSRGTCPLIVRKALERLSGVEKAEVTFQPPRAVVRYDPAKVTVGQMTEAVRKAGFQASRLDARPQGQERPGRTAPWRMKRPGTNGS